MPNVYICPAGYPTIGYRHLITYNKTLLPEAWLELFKGQVQEYYMSASEKDEILSSLNLDGKITKAGGLALLQFDIRRCTNISTVVKSEIFEKLTPGQIDSLTS